MEDPVTDADDYARHRQIVPFIADVTPISHSIPPSSSFGSHGVNTASPTNTLSVSKFTLPEGWYVKTVPRKNTTSGIMADKYYRDPVTGRYFRSLRAVERYITLGTIPLDIRDYRKNIEGGIIEEITPRKARAKRLNRQCDEKVDSNNTEEVTPRKARAKRLNYRHLVKNSGSQDMIVASDKRLDLEEDKDSQNQLAIVSPTSVSSRSSFKLPEGWVVEEAPRRSGNYVDKIYHEPGTGQKFRSLLAVQRYLAYLEDNSPLSVVLEEIKENNLPLSKAFKLSSCIKNCGSYNSWKTNLSRKEKSSTSASPPDRVNWVIAGRADTWNAFADETLVVDSVKQQWRNAFMMAINTKNITPLSG
uniref:methyl-CpG-binding domain-containing protein 7-like n=1 Tax=Erigeron canadensis TaxID=72917 RepID=UPI001CB8D6D8|nr:methyl-CpG-binding domain-containing protein 7-like [Erigeron canadensis]